jgi:RNA polymerase sigma-70 factor (ECF subfamily)
MHDSKRTDVTETADRLHRELMRAAQGGDGNAYERLLRDIVPLLRRYVRWRQGRWSREEIEDVVQDIIVSVHVARATYDPRRPLRPWLLAIARNRVADAARRTAQRSAHETAVDPLPETFSRTETNLHGETRAEILLMKRAIEGLSENQRQAIELLKLQELSLKEAAAATGLSVPALKVTVHRAIKSLRATFGRGTP